MGKGFACEYTPDKDKNKEYAKLYDNYMKLGRFIENEVHI